MAVLGLRFCARGLSLVAASGGHSSSRCVGLSLSQPLLLQSTGSRRAGSVIVAHGLSCSAACGIFPDQGSNPCPLHWQADSQPLRHQGSPYITFFKWQQFSGFQGWRRRWVERKVDVTVTRQHERSFWWWDSSVSVTESGPAAHHSKICTQERERW